MIIEKFICSSDYVNDALIKLDVYSNAFYCLNVCVRVRPTEMIMSKRAQHTILVLIDLCVCACVYMLGLCYYYDYLFCLLCVRVRAYLLNNISDEWLLAVCELKSF